MTAADRRLEIISPLIWVSHIHKAEGRLKKMYDAAEGEDKKSSNVSCGNMGHISWNCS